MAEYTDKALKIVQNAVNAKPVGIVNDFNDAMLDRVRDTIAGKKRDFINQFANVADEREKENEEENEEQNDDIETAELTPEEEDEIDAEETSEDDNDEEDLEQEEDQPTTNDEESEEKTDG